MSACLQTMQDMYLRDDLVLSETAQGIGILPKISSIDAAKSQIPHLVMKCTLQD